MKDYIVQRVKAAAQYVLQTGATVRGCAAYMKVSKTTAHKDLCIRLPRINPEMAAHVMRVLDENKAQRHLRGGAATRRKYGAMRPG